MSNLGGGDDVLSQIESMRTAPYQAGVLLGAATLRIMVHAACLTPVKEIAGRLNGRTGFYPVGV